MKSLKPHEEHLDPVHLLSQLGDTRAQWRRRRVETRSLHGADERRRARDGEARSKLRKTRRRCSITARLRRVHRRVKHDVPVATTLVDARAEVVARGMAPVGAEAFVHRFKNKISAKRATGHAKTPSILVLPGHRDVPPDGEEVRLLLKLADRLGESDSVSRPPAGWTGASLWQAGYREGFRRSVRMREELALSKHVVVLSSEAATVLRSVYPREGPRVTAEVLHVAEFLLRCSTETP